MVLLLIKEFWNNIVKSPLYWIPMFVLAIVGYGFSICNRTIGRDDLLKEYYNEVLPFTGRWGMLVWGELLGITDLVPFVDRFVSLMFLLVASILIALLFYLLRERGGDILSYTVLSSMLLTYPLINEVFEYTGANFQYSGNLALVILAFFYLTVGINNASLKKIKNIIVASLIMILPTSSYEVGIFSYITLLFAVILYKHLMLSYLFSRRRLFLEVCYYISPLFLAIVFRFFVHYTILFVTGSSYIQLGGSVIDYDNTTLRYLIGSNLFKYYVAGLVYFPITVFAVLSLVFGGYIIKRSISNRDIKGFLIAVLFYLSIFLLALLRGLCVDYRIAQTCTIFVAFVAFLICEIKNIRYRFLYQFLFLFLCWHQAVYLNNILALNNMRSNNEIACIRNLGNRIVNEYHNSKPVVCIVEDDAYGGYLGPWIEKRVYADTKTWNGQLFTQLVNRYLPEKYHHYKYVNSNINNMLNWTFPSQIKDFFSYCGYDINVVSFPAILEMEDNPEQKKKLENIFASSANSMNPMEILDVGECLLVKLPK